MYQQIKGRKIWYTDSGSGFCVVLLHGYLESSEAWNGFSEKLSYSFRVIEIDLPGHGQSEVYGDTHTMEMMAGVVKEILEKLSVKKVFLTGHSMGGYVVLAFLDIYPEYLAGYCLFHSQPFGDTPEAVVKRKYEISLVKEGKKDLMIPGNIEKMYATSNLEKYADSVIRSEVIAGSIPGEGIVAVLNGMMLRPSRVKVMEEGRVPCLWILGALDNYIPSGTIIKRVKVPSNAKILPLERSGHMGFIEEQDLCLAGFIDFVRKLA